MSDEASILYLLIVLVSVVAFSAWRFEEIGIGRTARLAVAWIAVFVAAYLFLRLAGYS